MFIPFGSILVTVAIFMVIVAAPMVVFGSKITEEDLEKDNFNLKPHIDGISNEKIKKYLNNGYLIISMITFIFLQLAPMVLVILYAISTNFDWEIDRRVPILTMILWGVIFGLKFKFHSGIPKRNVHLRTFVYFIFAIVIFIVYCDIRYRQANSILDGKADYYLKFSINNTPVETDDELLYFGETNKYIFLRDISTGKNHIYNRDEISELVFKKVEN